MRDINSFCGIGCGLLKLITPLIFSLYSLLRKNSLIFIQESIVTSFKNRKNSFL